MAREILTPARYRELADRMEEGTTVLDEPFHHDALTARMLEVAALLRALAEERVQRACLRCEGRGVRREYLNIAGDYKKHHCEACGGTGKETKR
jgi:hypothetical protein